MNILPDRGSRAAAGGAERGADSALGRGLREAGPWFWGGALRCLVLELAASPSIGNGASHLSDYGGGGARRSEGADSS